MLPKVTIVIPFYNCTFIDQAIQSALNQTYSNIEIIIVDDGSTIHAEKINPYLGQLSRVHYIRKLNGGTASALNNGISLATGEYIVWLSSDDLFYPDKIAKQMSYMLARNALFSFTNFNVIDDCNNLVANCYGMHFSNVIGFYRTFLLGNPINGCTVMIKKEFFNKLGLFNESLPYTHDYELWMRAIISRLDLYYLDECLTMYRVHEQMGTKKHRLIIQEEVINVQKGYIPLLTEFINQLIRENKFES